MPQEYYQDLEKLTSELDDFFFALGNANPENDEYDKLVVKLESQARDIKVIICHIFDTYPIDSIIGMGEGEMLKEVEKYERANPGEYFARGCYWWIYEILYRAVVKARGRPIRRSEFRWRGYMSVRDIAEEYGITKESALRKRLERLKKNEENNWDGRLYLEPPTRGPHDPMYYFNTGDERVKAIINSLL